MPWPRFEKSEMSDMLAYVREVSTSPLSEFRLLPADPVRGWQLFKTKSCIECHAVQGQGGHIGPDLGVGREAPMTMVEFAGAMWNHSPQMYREMNSRGIQDNSGTYSVHGNQIIFRLGRTGQAISATLTGAGNLDFSGKGYARLR